jgi:hypothetical protein
LVRLSTDITDKGTYIRFRKKKSLDETLVSTSTDSFEEMAPQIECRILPLTRVTAFFSYYIKEYTPYSGTRDSVLRMNHPALSPAEQAIANNITDAVMEHIGSGSQTGRSVWGDIFEPFKHILDPLFPHTEKSKAKANYHHNLQRGGWNAQQRRR